MRDSPSGPDYSSPPYTLELRIVVIVELQVATGNGKAVPKPIVHAGSDCRSRMSKFIGSPPGSPAIQQEKETLQGLHNIWGN